MGRSLCTAWNQTLPVRIVFYPTGQLDRPSEFRGAIGRGEPPRISEARSELSGVALLLERPLRRTLKMKKLITLLVATLALALVAFTPDIASAGRGHGGGHGWHGGGHGWHGGGSWRRPRLARRLSRRARLSRLSRLRLSRLSRLRLSRLRLSRLSRLGLGRLVGPRHRHLYRRLWSPLLVPDLRLLPLPLPLGLLGLS